MGFFLDVMDSNKFALSTTTSSAKLLSKLWRIKKKLIGVLTSHTPPTIDNKVWDEFYDKVVSTLSSFYEGRMRHGIPMSAAERGT